MQDESPTNHKREPGKPPNLLFVFADQLRRQAVGFMGEDPVLTPHLDRFAQESRVLTHAVSSYPLCSPYRAMLLTGAYPFSNGVLSNCRSDRTDLGVFLKPGQRCLPDVLRDAGYDLGYIGKWHLDGPRAPFVEPPRDDGFVWDEYTPPERRHGFSFWHAYGAFDEHLRPHYWADDTPREAPLEVRRWSAEHETDVALRYLKNGGGVRNPQKPFALFVSWNPPHNPFEQVPGRYVESYGDATPEELLVRPNVPRDGPATRTACQHVKNYFAAVTGLDEQFGRLMACLEEEGLRDDTLVVFTSDHGEMMGSQGRMYKNLPFEEALGVPFALRWPGRVRPGHDDLLLSPPDIMPTLLGLMGVGSLTPPRLEGENCAGAFLGEQTARPDGALYFSLDPARPTGGWRGLRTARYTYALNVDTHEALLYDNLEDPYQLQVLSSQASLAGELQHLLRERLGRIGDPWATGDKL